jgi:hypothetical protein
LICSHDICVELLENEGCRTTQDCSGGKVCVDRRCEDCDEDRQCGPHGVCREHRCECVECTGTAPCDIDERCTGDFQCTDFCAADEVFVARFDGDSLCRACIERPGPELPDHITLRCDEDGDCLEGDFCAQGFCIDRCGLRLPDFDDPRFAEIDELPFEPGLPPPECPNCPFGFGLIGLRGALERSGLTQPVELRLLDSGGKLVADFGRYAPKGRSWATLPERLAPELQQKIQKEGGCGYQLEIALSGGKSSARREICLEPPAPGPAPKAG